MADTIYLKKRLIGKEDINFDTNGTGETANFTTPDGVEKTLTKLNASHFPLTAETKNKLNASNVDEALKTLYDKQPSGPMTPDGLFEDTVVEIVSGDNAETIQGKIDAQKKNLNGYTLTFRFPASLTQNLYESLVWQDFYNGTIVVTGRTGDSRIMVSDQQDITALFKFYRCLCEVQIDYFSLEHRKSLYGILAESTTSMIVKECHFVGIDGSDSYAAAIIGSNVFFADCEFVNDEYYYPSEKKIDYLPLSGGTMTGDILSSNKRSLQIICGPNTDYSPSIKIFGSDLAETDPDYLNRGSIIFTAKDNTGLKTNQLLISPDGTLKIGKKDITLGYPNYAAVTTTTASTYTAKVDGWVAVTQNVRGSYIVVKINNVFVGGGGGSDYDTSSFFFPIKEGDKVETYLSDDGIIPLEKYDTKISFYPNQWDEVSK
jgi:hypothetical protein